MGSGRGRVNPVAGQVKLQRGGRIEVVAVQEAYDPTLCAPVFKVYLGEEPITRQFFDAKPEEFVYLPVRHQLAVNKERPMKEIRVDVVGNLLRPEYLKDALQSLARDEINPRD